MRDRPRVMFPLRRAGDADERRPAPRRRPGADPATGPSAAVPGNPVPPAPRDR
jgi:hypothetical protein